MTQIVVLRPLLSILFLVGVILSCNLSIALKRPVVNTQHDKTKIQRHMFTDQQQQQQHRRLTSSTDGKVDVPKPSSPDDHLVKNLPLLDEGTFPTDHWAGLLPASDDGHKYFFYWLFAPPGIDGEMKSHDEIPLIIWLNGGPACSSMDGLWLETGPFRLVDKAAQQGEGNGDNEGSSSSSAASASHDWKIEINPYSWHNTPAYVVYIDQPVGTGISFTTNGKHPRNDEEVNVDFYYFLQEFLKLHDDKFVTATDIDGQRHRTMKRPLYFAGESHAGHYIPSMMNYIRKQNIKLEDDENDMVTIPLSGAAIGNGWIDPKNQYSAHDIAYGYGIIGRSQRNKLAMLEKECQDSLADGELEVNNCPLLLNKVVQNSHGTGSNYKVSMYDVRRQELKKSDHDRDFPPGYKNVEAYLGGHHDKAGLSDIFEQVLEAIHSTPSLTAGQHYLECTDPPFDALKHQDGLGVMDDIADLLQQHYKKNDDDDNDEDETKDNKIRLLFFNGIYDLICNHIGNDIALDELEWKYQDEYILSKRYGWKSSALATTTAAAAATTAEDSLAGYMKEYDNLMYLKVLNSGHMVPMDVPDIALDMIRTFIYPSSSSSTTTTSDTTSSFESYEQKIDRLKTSPDVSCPVCPTNDTNNDNDKININNNNNGGDDDDDDDDKEVDCPTCPICPTQAEEEEEEETNDQKDEDEIDDGQNDNTKNSNNVIATEEEDDTKQEQQQHSFVPFFFLMMFLFCGFMTYRRMNSSGPSYGYGRRGGTTKFSMELPEHLKRSGGGGGGSGTSIGPGLGGGGYSDNPSFSSTNNNRNNGFGGY